MGVGIEPDDGLGRVFSRLEALERAGEPDGIGPDVERLAGLPDAGLNREERLRLEPIESVAGLAPPPRRLEHDVDPRRDRAGTDVGGVSDLERERRPVGRGRAEREGDDGRQRGGSGSAKAVGKHGAGSGIVGRGPLASFPGASDGPPRGPQSASSGTSKVGYWSSRPSRVNRSRAMKCRAAKRAEPRLHSFSRM